MEPSVCEEIVSQQDVLPQRGVNTILDILQKMRELSPYLPVILGVH